MSAEPVLADHALASRLERAEGVAGANYVEAQALAAPSSGAQWIEVAGAYALFCGPRSPVTQTFGLGLFQKPVASDLETLEAFLSFIHEAEAAMTAAQKPKRSSTRSRT